jgi:hypothetical protein
MQVIIDQRDGFLEEGTKDDHKVMGRKLKRFIYIFQVSGNK